MALIIKDWKEMHRGRILLPSALLIVLLSFLAMRQTMRLGVEVSFSTVAVPLFQVHVYLIPLLAMLLASQSMLHEKTQMALPILMARYYSPFRLILGKSLSAHTMTGAIVVAPNLLILAISRFFFGAEPGAFLWYLLSVWILSAVFTQIGCLAGAALGNKIQLLSAIVFAWFFFVYGYDLILMYMLPGLQAKDMASFSVAYMLSPMNALRYFLYVRIGAYDLSDISAVYHHLVFRHPAGVMLANAFAWMAASVALGVWLLRIRGGKAS